MATGGIDQHQLDRLFTAALEAAAALVEKQGKFLPLLFELRKGGDIQAVAVLEKESLDSAQSVLDRFAQILRPRAADGTIRAVAIAQHQSGQIAVRLRAANYAADIAVPYDLATSGILRRTRKLTLGALQMQPAENDIFGA
ncbi:hypothetical protein [Qipengyuania marisflavi]|uniref:Uncharacterized protein n=1 Tax=Qipengyuania marisflavi TaxID=2486356 RepID=A0A5S3P344_9SPHN|nr:hypothetical protein [Qipengyuania marisflavi]TMM47125.1 hypothetical protein FEV51_10040 [Qipengyuania marisflavi]